MANEAPDLALENCNQIISHLYLGGIAVAAQTQLLVDKGIRAVVCCVREQEFPTKNFHKDLAYYRIDVEDVSREPIDLFWPEALDFIHSWRSRGLPVLVHCRAGVSRSGSTVLAYLVAREGYSLHKAFFATRSRRPVVTPNIGFMEKLCDLEVEQNAGEPTISLDKYVSWYTGAELAENPDLASGAAVATAAEDMSPKGQTLQVKRQQSWRIRAAVRKLNMVKWFTNMDVIKEVDTDMPRASQESPAINARVGKIRALLLRHAAEDPELGYCQGMHCAATAFMAASGSPGEAYWRFRAFVRQVRGLWLPTFPLLEGGVAAFEEVARERGWLRHLQAWDVEVGRCLLRASQTLFASWLPLPTLVECIELLEGHGSAGVLSMAVAILDSAEAFILQQGSKEDVLQALKDLKKQVPDAITLAESARAQLPAVATALSQPSQTATLSCSRVGSRVVDRDGQMVLDGFSDVSAWLATEALIWAENEVMPTDHVVADADHPEVTRQGAATVSACEAGEQAAVG